MGRKCQKCGAKEANRLSTEVEKQVAELEACSPCEEKIEEKCDACAKRSNQFWMNYIGEERGWWWAIELARRQLLVVLYVFVQDWEIKQVGTHLLTSKTWTHNESASVYTVPADPLSILLSVTIYLLQSQLYSIAALFLHTSTR